MVLFETEKVIKKRIQARCDIRETTELKDQKHHSEPLLCFCWSF